MRATAILWHGQYRNDGLERLKRLETETSLWLGNPRLVGESSDWFLLADVNVYEALEDDPTRRAA